MSLLPVRLAHELESCPQERCWLVEGLWTEQAVGIIGGQPKSCKSFMALDMAVSVASGLPCLRRFPVPRKGRVLLYAAEDALHTVRQRLDGICHATGKVQLHTLDLHVITAIRLRLDLDQDRRRLSSTVADLRPKLLVLDPFIRLHNIDENTSKDVAPLLAFLRQLQRQYRMAVVVVHHARKDMTKTRAGQALRGSSEFHAWGDSNLYLHWNKNQLVLSIEHRAAPGQSGIPVQLKANGPALALQTIDHQAFSQISPTVSVSAQQRVKNTLALSSMPLPFSSLRKACRIRTATLSHTLAELTHQGEIQKTPAGYCLLGSQ